MAERLAFVADYFDETADMTRQYQVLFFPSDNTVELYNMSTGKMFLKRAPLPGVSKSDFFLGNTVVVYSRHLTLVSYGDAYTERALESSKERTLALVKPDGYQAMGRILSAILANEFVVARMRLMRLSADEAARFYEEHSARPFYDTLVEFMSSGYILAMELVSEGAIRKWRDLIGPTNSEVARQEAPQSLRAKYGTDATYNACHGSDSRESAARELDFFFGPGAHFEPIATLRDCACAVIKPHAVRDGSAGDILDCILEGDFTVTALRMFQLDKSSAAEFLEVYKGVIPEYNALVDEFCSGPCIAMEIRKDVEDVVGDFRQLVGPSDPSIAKVLRSNTIRAKFGKDKVQNGIHCTDLPEDGVLEAEYFFRLLA